MGTGMQSGIHAGKTLLCVKYNKYKLTNEIYICIHTQVFWVSQCSLHRPGTKCIDQAGLEPTRFCLPSVVIQDMCHHCPGIKFFVSLKKRIERFATNKGAGEMVQ